MGTAITTVIATSAGSSSSAPSVRENPVIYPGIQGPVVTAPRLAEDTFRA